MCRLRRDETKEGTDSDTAGQRTKNLSLTQPAKKTDEARISVRPKECFEQAVKNRGLERSFKQAIPQEVYERLEKEMDEIELEIKYCL